MTTTVMRQARAFDYPEHAHISADAIKVALATDVETRVVLGSAREVLHSTNLCDEKDLFIDAPDGCFALSDIPALSGDHAASPLLVKWRWFNDCLAPKEEDGFGRKIVRIVSGLNRFAGSPESVLLEAPRVPLMLALVRKYGPKHWPLANPPGDIDFLGADDAYVSLGERGRPHFRPALSAPTPCLASERNQNKPADQSFAWYADLHVGALTFARESNQHPERRSFFLGVATVLELTSLHYLEDSVAPGHMVPERWMNNGSRMSTHDKYSVLGVVARPSQALCDFVTKKALGGFMPVLKRHCEQTPGSAERLFGDHQLSSRKVEQESVTHDWAVAVAAASILEVVKASRESLTVPDVLEKCDEPVEDGAFHFSWTPAEGACGAGKDCDPGPDQRLYRCLYRWWENVAPINHAARIEETFTRIAGTALGMLPVPVANDEPVCGNDFQYYSCRDIAHDVYPSDIFFAGGGGDLQLFGNYSVKGNYWEPGATFGVRFVVPRSIAPVELGLGASVIWMTQHGEPLRSADADLDVRYVFARPVFAQASGLLGSARTEQGRYAGRAGGGVGLGVLGWSRTHSEGTLFAEYGGAGVTGAFLKLGGVITF